MTSATEAPFDLTQLYKATDSAPPPAPCHFLSASDGISLAVRVYKPTSSSSPKAALVFYHGGGAHSAAGYLLLAQRLATEYQIQVYTPDLRGHGESKGPRGDAPSVEQVFQDVDTILEYARQDVGSSIPLFLGGHSSGAGLTIQYATAHFLKEDKARHEALNLAGFLILSPQLGPTAGVTKDGSSSSAFCKVSILPFILNGIFGIMGHNPAVQFKYSPKELQGGNVPYNTVHMANAISPTNPQNQLTQMQALGLPMKLWIGEEDELFDASKIQKLYAPTEIVAKESHIGILVNAGDFLGSWLSDQVSTFVAK